MAFDETAFLKVLSAVDVREEIINNLVSFRWATVMSLDPLEVRREGEFSDITITGTSIPVEALRVGDKVRVSNYGSKAFIETSWDVLSRTDITINTGPNANDKLRDDIVDQEGKIEAAQESAQEAVDAAGEALAGLAETVVSTTLEYAVSGSDTVPPVSGWSEETPERIPGSYIWTRARATRANDDVIYSEPFIGTGNDGAPGAPGTSITGTEVRYQLAASGTTAPTGTWSVNPLVQTESLPYLWTRTVTSYSTGTPTTAYSVSQRGSQGSQGVSVTAVKPYFALVTTGASAPAQPSAGTVNPSAPWVETEPAYIEDRELWRTERITFSSGTTSWTTPQKSSSYAAASYVANLAEAATQGLVKIQQADPGHYPGRIWWQTNASGQGIGIKVSVSNAWVPYTIVADQILVPSSVGSIQLKDGAVTSAKILTGALDFKTANGLILTSPNIQTSTLATTGIKIVGNTFRAYGSGSTPLIEIDGTSGTIRGVDIIGVNIQGGQLTTGTPASFPRIDIRDNLWSNFIGIRLHANSATVGPEIKTNTATFSSIAPGGLFLTSQEVSNHSTELRLGSNEIDMFVNNSGTIGSRFTLNNASVVLTRANNVIFEATTGGTWTRFGTSNLHIGSTITMTSSAGITLDSDGGTFNITSGTGAGNIVANSGTGNSVYTANGSMTVRSLASSTTISSAAQLEISGPGSSRILMDAGAAISYTSPTHNFITAGPATVNAIWRMEPRTIASISRACLVFVNGNMPGTTLAANCHIDANGVFYKNTSSARSKLDVQDISTDPNLILDLPVRDWFDKSEVEGYASYLDGDEDEYLSGMPLRRIPGVVAEELEAVGLNQFVTYDTDGDTSNVLYDRLTLLLIPIVRDMRTRLEALEAQS